MTAFEVATSELAQQAITWPERARTMRITDQETYELACDELKGIKALRAKVEETFGPIVRKNYEAHKEAVLQRKKADDPLDQAERILKSSIGDWQIHQEQLRREEQRRLEEEARRRQEEELEREIEQAEAEDATPAEVEAIIDRGPSMPVAAPVAMPSVKPVAGVSSRELWTCEVTDLAAFIKFVAANPQYTMLLMPNFTALNQMARSLKSGMKLAGVRVYSQSSVAVRR